MTALVPDRLGRRGVDGFVEAFTALGGTVTRVPRRTDGTTLVAAVAAACCDGEEVLVAAPLDDAITEAALGTAGRAVAVARWPRDADRAPHAHLAVVPATAAVASTGSVVLDATTLRGRAAGLVTPRIVYVVDAAAIVDTVAQVLRGHHERWPSGPPSQVVLATGPSRSADIEMTLTVGIHGPGVVHTVVVE
jgi:L-lactate utilization protein LutC